MHLLFVIADGFVIEFYPFYMRPMAQVYKWMHNLDLISRPILVVGSVLMQS